MTFVVDASVVVAYLTGNGDEVERAAITDASCAPGFLDVEVTQTLRGLVRGGRLRVDYADAARSDLAHLLVTRYPDEVLLGRAWELRDVCTTYDALYVALAELLDVTLLTRDARLHRGAHGHPLVGCRVRLAGV